MSYDHRLPFNGPGLDSFSFPNDIAAFAIGDVHGCADGLDATLAQIAATQTPDQKRVLVMLGDLVDRGEQNVRAMRSGIVEAAERAAVDEVINLPGNHELLMVDTIEAVRNGETELANKIGECWLRNGGIAFVDEVFQGDWPAKDFISLFARELEEQLGIDDIVATIRSWPSHARIGDALFVHAGVAPKKPITDTLEMSQQSGFPRKETSLEIQNHQRHWAWIRNPFLQWQHGFPEDGVSGPGCLVVHGHTSLMNSRKAVREPDCMSKIMSNARICLDVGAASDIAVGSLCMTSEGVGLYATPALAFSLEDDLLIELR